MLCFWSIFGNIYNMFSLPPLTQLYFAHYIGCPCYAVPADPLCLFFPPLCLLCGTCAVQYLYCTRFAGFSTLKPDLRHRLSIANYIGYLCWAGCCCCWSTSSAGWPCASLSASPRSARAQSTARRRSRDGRIRTEGGGGVGMVVSSLKNSKKRERSRLWSLLLCFVWSICVCTCCTVSTIFEGIKFYDFYSKTIAVFFFEGAHSTGSKAK